MDEFRLLLLALSLVLISSCGPGADDDDDSAVDDDDVADDDDASDDDDSSAGDDDDSSGDDDDDSAGDDDDSSVGDDDDAAAVMFNCGSALQCEVDSEFCQIGYPGVPPSEPSYSCEGMPKACVSSPECSCIVANVEWKEASCSSGPLGGDTVEIYYP